MLNLLLKHRRYLAWGYVLLLLALMHPTVPGIVFCSPLVLLGAFIRAWASGCIEKNVNIAWSGPYRHVRNPLYIGSFLIGLGFTLMANHWLLLLLFLSLYLIVYRHGVLSEEKLLTAKFGHDFKRYCEHVPRFIPRCNPTRELNIGYRSYLMWQHREYNAWLAIIAVYLIMLAAFEYPFPAQGIWKVIHETGRIY